MIMNLHCSPSLGHITVYDSKSATNHHFMGVISINIYLFTHCHCSYLVGGIFVAALVAMYLLIQVITKQAQECNK